MWADVCRAQGCCVASYEDLSVLAKSTEIWIAERRVGFAWWYEGKWMGSAFDNSGIGPDVCGRRKESESLAASYALQHNSNILIFALML